MLLPAKHRAKRMPSMWHKSEFITPNNTAHHPLPLLGVVFYPQNFMKTIPKTPTKHFQIKYSLTLYFPSLTLNLSFLTLYFPSLTLNLSFLALDFPSLTPI
jgi:hypothetical protein